MQKMVSGEEADIEILKNFCPFQQLLDAALNQVCLRLFLLRLSHSQSSALSRKMKSDAKSTLIQHSHSSSCLAFVSTSLELWTKTVFSVFPLFIWRILWYRQIFFFVAPKAMVRGKKPNKSKANKQTLIYMHIYIYMYVRQKHRITNLKDGKFLQSSFLPINITLWSRTNKIMCV